MYENIGIKIYTELLKAPSKGKYFYNNIAYKFKYQRLSKYEDWYKFGKDIFCKNIIK